MGERTHKEAEREMERLGIRDGERGYAHALDASMRGWPAWRIAQYLMLSDEKIYELGGPKK
jgi:hypothetical protein